MTTASSNTVLCAKCKRYAGQLKCLQCQRLMCNLHYCDVCQRCARDCVCWSRPGAVYHPPVDEPPPR